MLQRETTAGFQIAMVFHCKRVSLVKALPGLGSDNDIKPETLTYRSLLVLVSASKSVRIAILFQFHMLAELAFACVYLL